MNIRFFYSPDGDGTEGLPPSLSSLDIKPTDPSDISTLTGVPPENIIPPNPPAPPADPTAPVVDPVNPPDPNKPAGEQKPPENTDEGEKTDPEPPQESFWEVTEKITGRPVPVEYPEGVEPDTPQGAAIREAAVRSQTWDDFDANLRATNPRGYAYMVHLENGGTDEEFFNSGSRNLILPTEEEFNGSVDVQASVYRSYLISQGLDPEDVETVIAKAAKDNKLLDKSKGAYAAIAKAQDEQLREVERIRVQKDQEIHAAVTSLKTRIDKGISNIISVVVPETEKAAFQQHIMDKLQYDATSKKFHIVHEVSEEDLKTQLEMLFLDFKKGDLSKIIEKKSGTIAAQRLRVSAEKTKNDVSGGTGIGKTNTKRLTLGEL